MNSNDTVARLPEGHLALVWNPVNRRKGNRIHVQ